MYIATQQQVEVSLPKPLSNLPLNKTIRQDGIIGCQLIGGEPSHLHRCWQAPLFDTDRVSSERPIHHLCYQMVIFGSILFLPGYQN